MSFSQLIEKLAAKSDLNEAEKQELVLQSRSIEQAASLLNSMVSPGSGIVKIDNAQINTASIRNADIISATAGGGDVSIDTDGIWITNQQAAMGFEDTNGNRFNLTIYSDGTNNISIQNSLPGQGVIQEVAMTDLSNRYAEVREDETQANRLLFRVNDATTGARITIGDTIDMRSEGGTTGGRIAIGEGLLSGSAFLRIVESVSTPSAGGSDAFHMYMKGDKLIIQFDALGTAHYFYLDLTATVNQSWIYSATAP